MTKIKEIKKLHRIATVLLTEKRIDKVLNAVVKNAADFFSADASSILLFDERKEYLKIAHSYNLSKEYVRVVKVRYDEDVAGKVASLQKPVVIPDIMKLFKSMGDNLSVRWFKKEKLVSCVDSPVVIGKNSIGCLNLYYRRKYVFRKSDLDVLKIFCDFSAIAIQNAKLIKKIEDELKSKLIFEKIGSTMTSTLRLNDVIKTFLSTATNLTGTKTGSILMVDEKEKKIQKAYNYYKKGDKIEVYTSTARLKKGLSGTVLRRRKPVAIENLSKEKDVNPTALEKKRKGVLAVPVMMKNKIIAILYVDSDKPRSFSNTEMEQVQFLANQAAAAIENARLYNEIEQKIRDLSISYKISQILISTIDLNILLTKILEELKNTFGYVNLAILLIDEKINRLVFKAATGYLERVKKLKLQVGREGITGYVAKTGKTYYSPDVTKDKRYIIGVKSVRSEVAIPLKIENKTIGVLDVESKEYDGFSEWEIKLLTSIAAQLAIAIEKSRLFEKTKVLSLTDPLTELPNRRHFDIIIDAELKRSARYNRPLSLLLIDFDNFKKYNDDFGHIAGDKVLKEYAGIMKSAIREVDFICRYGGDEFIVVLPETDETFARAVAQRIITNINKGSKKFTITLSIGVSTYPLDGEDKNELVHAADKACYIAKEKGGNCVKRLLDKK